MLDGLELEVRAGEIVGIAGIEGNGQNELLQLLLSPRPYFHARGLIGGKLKASGHCEILGQDSRGLTPRAVRGLGVGVVPEDRHRQGLVLPFSLAENFLLGQESDPRLTRHGWIRGRALRAATAAAIAAFDIRPADAAATAASLSGGNQQKLIMARELARSPRLLVCAQPTRGVDVGSIEFIHGQLLAARTAGCAVLLISSSLDEVMALSDRILVLYEGRFTAAFARGEADEAAIGRFMAGGRHEAEA